LAYFNTHKEPIKIKINVGPLLAALPQKQRPVTHYIKGWMDLGVDPDGSGKSQPIRFREPAVQSVANRYTDYINPPPHII